MKDRGSISSLPELDLIMTIIDYIDRFMVGLLGLTLRKNVSCRVGGASPRRSLLIITSPRGDRTKNCEIIRTRFLLDIPLKSMLI